MKKIKVFEIVPDLGIGGGEKLVIDIASNLNKQEFDVTIISLYPSKKNFFENIIDERNIKVNFLNKKNGLDISIIFKLIKLFKNEKPDILHTHLNVVPYVLPAAIISGIKGRVHTIHSLAQTELSSVNKVIMFFAYKFFKFVPVAICDYVKKTIVEVYRLKENKIPCIYNGIDLDKFVPLTKKYDNKFIKLIHTGSLFYPKNHMLLLEAFALSLKQYPEMQLTLVGDGILRSKIENKIIELNISKNVILKGFVKDVEKELNESDLFIFS
ncbi:MAG TPA: glycosyltransferase, partial [Candidatus Paceibacterota bacterium]